MVSSILRTEKLCKSFSNGGIQQHVIKNLYMNYQTNEKIQELLSPYKYVEIYEIEKIETLEGTIDSNNNITMFKILKK